MVLPRLIASDLDGTLCLPDGTVSDRTRRALAAAAGAGLRVVFVTGRPPRFVGQTIEATGIDEPVICSNGAVVYDPAGQVILTADTLTDAELAEVVALVRTAVPDVALALEWGTTFTFESEFARLLGRAGVPVVNDVLAHEGDSPHKLLAIHHDLLQEELALQIGSALDGRMSVTHSGLRFIEMGPRGVTKATGLARWCSTHGIARHEVVAFGDMPNDVDMLEWAGWAVAMGNAHPAAKAAADEIAPTNLDDGVAVVVERLLADAGRHDPSAPSAAS